MQPEAPKILRGGGVSEFSRREFFDRIPVVVMAQQFHVRQPRAVQGGPEEVADELCFVLRGVGAGFPPLVSAGFVLHREGPDRDALFLGHGLDEIDINPGPSRTVFPAEGATVIHAVVIFHPSRRAPGGGHQLEAVRSGYLSRVVDQRHDPAAHRFESEIMQVVVAGGGGERPEAQRKVATVDVGAGQCVTDALLGVIVAAKNRHPIFRRQLGQYPGGGLGERTAEADDFLERLGRIADDGALDRFRRLGRCRHGAEFASVLLRGLHHRPTTRRLLGRLGRNHGKGEVAEQKSAEDVP